MHIDKNVDKTSNGEDVYDRFNSKNGDDVLIITRDDNQTEDEFGETSSKVTVDIGTLIKLDKANDIATVKYKEHTLEFYMIPKLNRKERKYLIYCSGINKDNAKQGIIGKYDAIYYLKRYFDNKKQYGFINYDFIKNNLKAKIILKKLSNK